MADREQPYDPYIPAGGNNAQGGAQGQSGNHRTAALQAVCPSSMNSPRLGTSPCSKMLLLLHPTSKQLDMKHEHEHDPDL